MYDYKYQTRKQEEVPLHELWRQRREGQHAVGEGNADLADHEANVAESAIIHEDAAGSFQQQENNNAREGDFFDPFNHEEIDPEEQEKLKSEFNIYAAHKLELINQGIDLGSTDNKKLRTKEEKKNKFIAKRDRFQKRMNRSEHNFWGTKKYYRLLDKWFPDYVDVLEHKVTTIKNTVKDVITSINKKIIDVIKVLKEALILDTERDISEVLNHINTADKYLNDAIKSKDNAVLTLTGFPENKTQDFLVQYDTVLDMYQELILNLQTAIGDMEGDKSRFETAVSQLSQQQTSLVDFNLKIQNSSDVLELVRLQDTEFTDLISSTVKIIEATGNLKRTAGAPDEDLIQSKLDEGKASIAALDKRLVEITGGVSSVYWGKGIYYGEEVDALYIVAKDYSAASRYTRIRKFDGFWFFVDNETGWTSGMQQKDAVEKYYLANPISPQELSYFLIYLKEIGVSKEIVKKIQERGYASEPFRIQVEKVQLELFGKKPKVGFGLYTPITREAIYEKVQHLIPEIDESPYKPLDTISDEDKKLIKKMSTSDANEVYKAYKADDITSTTSSISNNDASLTVSSLVTTKLFDETAHDHGFDGAPDFWKHMDKLNDLFQRRALQIANNMLDNTEILIRLELDSYKKNPERIEQLTKALAPAREEYENYFHEKWEDERYVMTTGNSEVNDWASMGQRHAKNAESKVRNLGSDHPLISYFSKSESKMDQLMGNLGLVYQPYGMPQYDFIQKKQVSDGKTNPYTNTTYSGLFEDPFNPAKTDDASKNVSTSDIKLIINQGAQEMLQNIKKTREALKKSPKSVWKLDNVVALTRFDLGIDPEADTAARKIIDDQIWIMNFDPLDLFLTVINIGLGILAATGIGTAPALVLMAGLGAVGTSAIQFYRHYKDYEFMKAASGTAPVPEASLSSITPDNSWFFWDMIGLGLDFFAALKIIGLLGKSVILFKSGKLLKPKFLKEITENAPRVLGKTQAAEMVEGITKKLDDVNYVKQIQNTNAVQLNKEVDDVFQNLSKILDGHGIKAMNGLKPEVFDAMTKLMKTLINKGVKSFDDFMDIVKAQSKFSSSLGEINLSKLSPNDLSRLEQKFGEELENLKILNKGTGVVGPSKIEIAQQDLRESLRKLHIATNNSLGMNRIPLAELIDVTAKAVKYGYFKLEEGIVGLRKFLRSQGIDEAKIPDEDLQKVLDEISETSNVKPKENGNLVESSLEKTNGIIPVVKRVGVNKFGTTEVSINRVQKLHGVPKKGTPPNHIDDLMKDFKSNGYNLESGPPIEGFTMPDGQIIIIDGHHRLAALERLGETNIPIRIHPEISDEGLRKMLKIGEYSGFYPPSKYPSNFEIPDFGKSLNLDIDMEAEKFVQENF